MVKTRLGLTYQEELLCAVLSCSLVFDSWQPLGLQPGRLLCPWDSPGRNTGVGRHALLKGVLDEGCPNYECTKIVSTKIYL